ncbi:MAG: hypothetical protein COA44_13495 [Arcobacter sp.]|nr:MAG: hypothetical protein COA44_13495 [Arcobacter sp.]
MKKILILLLSLGAFLYAGPKLTYETQTLLKNAKLQVPSFSAEKTLSLLKEGNIILIDVREAAEWDKGVIKTDKLVKLQRGWLEIQYPKLILEKYSQQDTFVVYCGIEPRSILAASRLKELGFRNVAYLKGGMKNWTKSKLPITKNN